MTLTSLLLADILSDTRSRLGTLFTHSAVGTGTTSPTAADTALETEVLRDARDDFDTSVAGAVTASLRIGLTEANGNELTETGWFNDETSGTMWTRNTFTAINKTSDIQIFLDTTITVSVVEG